MIEKLKYLLAGSLLLAAAGGFVACDDDETTVDEWESTYVLLERPVLGSNEITYSIRHTDDGLSGWDGLFTFAVSLSKPCASDVMVKVGFDAAAELPEGLFLLGENGQMTIPAGETQAVNTLQCDLQLLTALVGDNAASYTVPIRIETVVPSKEDLRISSKQNDLIVNVNKGKLTNVIVGQQPSGTDMDRSGWTVSVSTTDSETADNFRKTSNLTDDNAWSYEYVYTYLCIQIDLGAETSVTGLETYSAYGAAYAHTSCQIYSSVDGVNWIPEHDRVSIAADTNQYVSFIKPVKARYFRWRMWGSNVLSSEMYVYQAE